MLPEVAKHGLRSKCPKSPSQLATPALWGGAGVLPFARANNPTNDIYLLLGKEDIIPNWKFGSNKWCDFSGGKEESDADIEETAARELYEESLAAHPLWEHEGPCRPESGDRPHNRPWRNFAGSLRQSNYAHRFDRTRADGRSPSKSYACFLVEVPFCPGVGKEFEKIRARLVRLRNLSKSWHEKLREIDDMEEDVRDALMTFLPGQAVAYNSKDQSFRITDELDEYRIANVCIMDGEWVHVKLTAAKCVQTDGTKPETHCYTFQSQRPLEPFPAHTREKICSFVQSWTRLLEEFRSLPYAIRKHPAISATRVPNTSYIYDITVLECYMEKQAIKWWSLPWLRESLQNGGAFRMELFRGPFLPFLSVVLDLFSGASPGRFIVDVRPWTSSSTFGYSLKKKSHSANQKSSKQTKKSKVVERVHSQLITEANCNEGENCVLKKYTSCDLA